MSGKFKLLLAYDGSEGASDALDDLMRAGLPAQATVNVLAVAHGDIPHRQDGGVDSGPDARRPLDEMLADAKAVAERGARLVSEIQPAWDVRSVTRTDSPAAGIIALADEWCPDLLVIGSRGRPAAARWLLGSVAQKVLAGARCSVRIGRVAVGESAAPPRVLVAYDGSEDAYAAVEQVAARPWPEGTEAEVLAVDDVYVYQPLLHGAPGDVDAQTPELPEEHRVLERVVQDAADLLRSSGLSTAESIVIGGAKGGVVERAAAWPADVIFAGVRSGDRLRRFLMGSVSTAIAQRARCSVEVVRRTHR